MQLAQVHIMSSGTDADIVMPEIMFALLWCLVEI